MMTAHNWPELHGIITSHHADLVIFDPDIDASGLESALRLLEAFPSIAFVLYTQLKPSTARLIHRLAQRGLMDVIVQQFDDNPRKIQGLLDEIPQRRLLPLVLLSLRDQLQRLPESMRTCIEHILDMNPLPRSADAFARDIGVSRQHLYDTFRRAGLGSPRRFVIGARLLKAYSYLRDPGRSFGSIATAVGWTDPDALRKYLEQVFQMPVATLRQTSDNEALVKRIVHWMQAVPKA